MSVSTAPKLLADRRTALPDIQAEAPEHAIALSQVGVSSMRLPLIFDRGPAIATLRLGVNLPANQRGAHMSRFRRAIDAMPEGLAPHRFASALAEELLSRHQYASTSHVVVETEALVGDIVLPLVARAQLGASPRSEVVERSSITMKVLGSTVCPCSFAMSGDRYAHVQRAELRVELTDPSVSVAEVHSLCSQAFSAPVAMVLDRPAEKALVDRMFAHPRFVEDVAREAVNNLRLRKAGSYARITATAFESIHPYDCYAAWEGAL